MELYETQDDYTLAEINVILQWFNVNIGTDHELNESASGNLNQFYLVFFELLNSEVILIREMENSFRRQHEKEES